ncbi:MAG TPA: polysaccharide biosynthesis tyrosine autokinase [Gemmatimonadales bacterium]|nr:polysaccharide biosynthesis tyrosine autokinase [Gemmatimonadales bacterium]
MSQGLVPHLQSEPSLELSRYQGGGLGPAAPDPEAGGVPWARYLMAVRRYRWLIIALTIVGTGLGVLSTRLVHPVYTANATIFIERAPDANGPIRPDGLLETNAWVDLLRSWVVLDSTALRLRLYLQNDPADSLVFANFGLGDRFVPGQYVLQISDDGKRYELRNQQGAMIEGGPTGGPMGMALGVVWNPPAEALGRQRKIRFGLITPREASAAINNNLVALLPEDGNFMNLSITGESPQRIAAILNTITEQFVGVAADLKKRKLTILARTLEDQTQTTRVELERAENALESFRTSTITLPNEGVPVAAGLQQTQPTVITNFFKQKMELEALRNDRKGLEDVLAKTQAGELAVDAFQTIPAVRTAPDLSKALTELSDAEAELRALQNRYTDEYKPVQDLKARIQRLRQEIIPAYAGALIAQLRNQEQTLESQITTEAGDIQKIPVRTITEQRLTRDAASAATLFTTLQNRYEETKLALASSIPDVKVLVPAMVPSQPERNRAPIFILLGFLAGLAAGVGLAILLDQLDKRFRYPEQVTDELGLSILGAVPAIKKNAQNTMSEEDASQVVEAFRTIRMNLAHSYGSAGPVLLTITSPGPGEGKSFVSSNLALSFAEAGYQTVLIDGDIRRGELHRMFNIDRRPGLMDHLAGACALQDVVRPSGHTGLSVVACGTRRHQGPELLGSSAMNLFMAEMKSRYNVIIVDSPPLGAGIDPFVLSTSTGHMMLVLRSGETDRALAEAKLKLLERLPIRLLGAVLNDIKAAEGAYKYYGYVYGYSAEEDGAPAQISSRSGQIS